MSALIRTELPLGTNRKEVIQFLDDHYIVNEANKPKPGSMDMISAVYRNMKERDCFVRGGLKMKFFFRENKLETFGFLVCGPVSLDQP